jgi:glycerophosphoryl diester phosphodiesterase
VDDPRRMAELVDVGVDGIITNVPDVARRVIDGRS